MPSPSRRTTALVPHGPPRLTMPLWRNLGLMLLVNIVPIVVMIWAFAGGKDRPGLDPKAKSVALALVGACLVVAVCAWVVLPFARWLRDYPRWCFLHRTAWLWLLPAVAGFLAWMAIAIVAVAAVLGAIVAIASAFFQLFHHQA
jgi:hypothetical protein